MRRWWLILSQALGLRSGDKPMAYICSAELYEDLFAEVRAAIVAGDEFSSIQQTLDDRFSEVLRGTHTPSQT